MRVKVHIIIAKQPMKTRYLRRMAEPTNTKVSMSFIKSIHKKFLVLSEAYTCLAASHVCTCRCRGVRAGEVAKQEVISSSCCSNRSVLFPQIYSSQVSLSYV
jgi:hypothetical protein